MLTGPSPQWSPVFATGVTSGSTPGSTPAVSCRNGARSSRPGSPPTASTSAAGHPASRNGARSSRPGSPGRGPSHVRPLLPSRNGARSSRPGSPVSLSISASIALRPQWSPVFATGVTSSGSAEGAALARAAMEPGLRDRGHASGDLPVQLRTIRAAMEPGLRDRGHMASRPYLNAGSTPQWSPVFATGVTSNCRRCARCA